MTEYTLIANTHNVLLSDEKLGIAFKDAAKKHRWRVPDGPDQLIIFSDRFYFIEFDGRTRNSCRQPKPSKSSRYSVTKRIRQDGSAFRLTIELYFPQEIPITLRAKVQRESGHKNESSMRSYLDDVVYSFIRNVATLWNGYKPKDEEKFGLEIRELPLSSRVCGCLYTSEIFTVEDLICMTDVELLKIRNFGMRTLNEVKARLSEINLSLKETVPPSEE